MNPLSLALPTAFHSKRLQLRCYRPEDSSLYCQMLLANHNHLYEFLPPFLEAVQNEADAERVIRQLAEEWQRRNLFIFGVWEQENGRYVGETYLANADWDVPCIELGYFVIKDKTGQGYATEAAQATIKYAFEQMTVSRVELQCAADNEASQHVAKRCGFTFEGRQRQRQHKKGGALVDRLWYGLLLAEWQQDGR